MLTSVKKKPRGKGRPFPPGISPNPAGGPYVKQIAQIRSELFQCASQQDRKEIFAAILKKAKEGCPFHIEFLMDHWIGKVPVKQEIETTLTLTTEQKATRIREILGLTSPN